MILVTGTNGFIGSHYLRFLCENYQDKIVIVGSKANKTLSSLLWIQADYNNPIPFTIAEELREKIEYIVHLGSFTPKSNNEISNIEKANQNIQFTSQFLSYQFPNLKRFVFASTLDVYAADQIISETSSIQAQGMYALSKFYCERMLEVWASQNNYPLSIARIGHVFGPGEEKYKKLIPLVFEKIKQNQTLSLFGTGNELRNFIYVDDVVQALFLLTFGDTCFPIINVVGEESITVKNLIELLLQITNSNLPIDHQQKDQKGKDFIFDNRLLKSLLKQPLVPLELGLKKEWEYLQNLNK
jgi:UDP-glucose 4-epimerase